MTQIPPYLKPKIMAWDELIQEAIRLTSAAAKDAELTRDAAIRAAEGAEKASNEARKLWDELQRLWEGADA